MQFDWKNIDEKTQKKLAKMARTQLFGLYKKVCVVGVKEAHKQGLDDDQELRYIQALVIDAALCLSLIAANLATEVINYKGGEA